MQIRRSKGRRFLAASRRVMLAVTIPAALLLVVRLFWGWAADHRLASVRAELCKQGVRIDAPPPPHRAVPDDQNAALAVTDAVQAVSLSESEKKLVNEGDGGRVFVEKTWTDAHVVELRHVLARHARALHAAEIAIERPVAYWSVTTADVFEPGVGYVKDHPILEARQLINLLFVAAVIAHQDHADAEALKYLQSILAVARAVDQESTEAGHVVACAFRAVAAQTVERMAADLRLQGADGSADAARGLLAMLLEVPRDREFYALGWEREIGTTVATPQPGMQAFTRWWFAPLMADETTRTLRAMAVEVPSVRADNWAESKRIFPQRRTWGGTYLEVTTMVISDNAPSAGMYTTLHFRALSDCAAASLLLASALYQQQEGRYPAAASDLVPTYLPTLPVDPYAADHRPMAYRLDPEGPTVWSVNENGTDEGGHVMLGADGVRIPRHRWSSDPKAMPPDTVYGAAWTHAPATAPPRPPSLAPGFPSFPESPPP